MARRGKKDGGRSQRAAALLDELLRQDDGRAPQESTTIEGGIRPISQRLLPKNHPPGAFKRGDSVWYRGRRYWVEFCPSDWSNGTHVRISDERVHPDPDRPLPVERLLAGEKSGIESFCVHADLLSLAPVRGSIYARQPSIAQVARSERRRQGVRDVGDEVALILRKCSSLDEMYDVAARHLGLKKEELKAKYGHLNPGQQRMLLGNRMRVAARKK